MSSTISVDEFKETYPEFSSGYSDTTINLWLSFAVNLVNEAVFKNNYKLGVYSLLAHFLYYLYPDGFDVNNIPSSIDGDAIHTASSVTVGNISESYNIPTGDFTSNTSAWKEFLSKTKYGQIFLSILHIVSRGVGATIV